MFDAIKYRACFDEVRAPESIEREILKMTVEKRNKRRFSANSALAVAVVLILLLGLGAVASAAGWFESALTFLFQQNGQRFFRCPPKYCLRFFKNTIVTKRS